MSQTEEEYDALYDKGFDESVTNTETEEEVIEEEVLEQPEETTEEEVEATEPDEVDSEVTEDEVVEDSETKTFKVKHKGVDLDLTEEELLTLASKGFDYTSKTQDLASRRRTLDIVDGLDDELLTTLKDAKSGNTEAVAKLVKDFGIDPYDIDTTTSYKPEVLNKNYELEDVVTDINNDTDNAEQMNSWVNSMTPSARAFLQQNPMILKEFHEHTRNGIAQKVMPEVLKQMAINPATDFMGTYNGIYRTVMEQKEVAPVSKPEATRESKKKATISKSKTNKMNDHKDVWEDDDLYAQMQKMVAR